MESIWKKIENGSRRAAVMEFAGITAVGVGAAKYGFDHDNALVLFGGIAASSLGLNVIRHAPDFHGVLHDPADTEDLQSSKSSGSI